MAFKTKLNDKKICKRCNERIHEDDKFTLLGTYWKGDLNDEVFFHFRCYIDWINESIAAHSNKQMKQLMDEQMGKFQPMLNKLQGFMEG
jgi:hypothetical protein